MGSKKEIVEHKRKSRLKKSDSIESVSKGQVMKKRIKTNVKIIFYILIAILVFTVIFLFIYEIQKKSKEKPEIVEESVGSGFLEIETSPSNADVFVDNIYRGKSPLTLKNIPAGSHNIIIKKEDYKDYISEADIKPGRKTSLEIGLVLIAVVDEKTEIEEIIKEKEKIEIVSLKGYGIVNIGKRFLLYYDFSKGNTTNFRKFDTDIFSKRYDKHLVFTRIDPVNIKTIDKNIEAVKKEDCIGVRGQFEFLNSGQSLCVITRENEVSVIGGNWEETENAVLSWKLFS